MGGTRNNRGRPGPGIPATEAAKTFGRLVDRVREERATYVIERGGTPVAQIAPFDDRSFTFADLKALVATLPGREAEYGTAVARVVARHTRPRVRRNPWER